MRCGRLPRRVGLRAGRALLTLRQAPDGDLRRLGPPGVRGLRGGAAARHPRAGGPQRDRLRRPADGALGRPAADDDPPAAVGDGRDGGAARARAGLRPARRARDVARGSPEYAGALGVGSPPMRRIGVVVNGVTGRMGYRQHLVRSLLAIREQGGVELRDGTRLMPEPILVGRREAARAGDRRAPRARALDDRPRRRRWRTPRSTSTPRSRPRGRRRCGAAIAAGKHVYTEKPTAESARRGARARAAGRRGGRHATASCRTSCSCPGLLKLRRLVEGGFFGRILSVRGEFGYWVFEGDWQAPNRPSWNYRAEEGGGIALDMLCHWRYVLDKVIAPVRSVSRDDRHAHPRARATRRASATPPPPTTPPTRCSSSRAAIDRPASTPPGPCACSATSSSSSRSTARRAARWPGCAAAASSTARATPRAVWNPDVAGDRGLPLAVGRGAGQRGVRQRASRSSGRRSCATWPTDEPFPWDLLGGRQGRAARQLGLRSAAEGRRLEVPRRW